LVPFDAGWARATPLKNWRVDRPEMKGNPSRLEVVLRPEGGRQPLRLQARLKAKEVTAVAVYPAWQARGPILAVGFRDESDQPMLCLYNGQSGEQVRQLTGHVADVRSLNFSEDGRLLVSAAEDRMMCLWSLTDLDNVLGQRGQLAGVAVEEKQNALVV